MYKFTIEEVEYEVPAFSDIPTGALRKARKSADEIDKAFTILEEAVGTDSEVLKVLDKLTLADFAKWLEGWTQGAPLGESSSSEN